MQTDSGYFFPKNIRLVDDEMLAEAKELAFLRTEKKKRPFDKAAFKLSIDKKRLFDTYKVLLNAKRDGHFVPGSAGEMFFDNFYLVEKALLTLETDMRVDKSASIPISAEGGMLSLPRVYIIVSEFFSCTGGRFSENFYEYIMSFQSVSPLYSDELFCLPIMIKIALIKLMSLEAMNILVRISEHEHADAFFSALTNSGVSEKRKSLLIGNAVKTLSDVGILRLRAKLIEADEFSKKDLLTDEAARLKNINSDELFSMNSKAEERENQIVKNVINSLRLIDTTDFAELTERLSLIERALSFDSVYVNMDSASKQSYREEVVRIAKQIGVDEAVIAKRAAALSENKSKKQGHVGYYIIGAGKTELINSLLPEKKINQTDYSARLFFYIVIQLAILLPILLLSFIGSPFYVLLGLIPALSIAAFLGALLFKSAFPVNHIPRIKVIRGAGENARTLVTIPVLILDKKSLDDAIDEIETHYAGNPLQDCFFSILCDFKDADYDINDTETKLVETAKERIEALNKKYQRNEPIFYLFFRKREFNKNDNIFMGYERKRGAVMALVKLIVESDGECFFFDSPPLPQKLKYITVLDADTYLAPGSLSELIGAMIHPLNAPVSDKFGIVKEGHAVIAPRIETTAVSAAKSRFSALMSFDAGMNTYTGAVSDLYQDAFDEGLFTGKGIFDIDCFYNALMYRIPENTVLSHDVLEGCILRSGYMSDTILYDGEPGTFAAYQKRAHRWIRGDWQLIRFLGRKFPETDDTKRSEFLSGLSRYKLFDNLRRSLTLPLIFLAFFASIFTGFRLYTLVALIALILPEVYSAASACILAVFRRNADLRGTLFDCFNNIKRALFSLFTLPTTACDTIDAIIRSLYRVYFSRKNMLEWITAAAGEKSSGGIMRVIKKMRFNIIFGIFFLLSPIFSPNSGILTSLYGAFLTLMPIITAFLELPFEKKNVKTADREILLKTARSIYAYFNDFCNEKTHYLPPDNFQESPKKLPVRHTSPTNIGMALMATLSAYDLNIISEDTLISRLAKMTESIKRLEKLNGHLYNWYDIESMEKIHPCYVSTVDSGNLAASLIVTAEALRSIDSDKARELSKKIDTLSSAMDFSMLYSEERGLFYIGFDAENGSFNNSCYDMLASEARLTYFVAIAEKQIPAKSWLLLSRLLVRSKLDFSLVSWGGTCFEYLMPVLFTGSVKNTLMDETLNTVASTMERYAAPNKIFGISESGFFAFDKFMYYQYKAFGVPKLALSKMRERELVIAPYASLLLLMVDPEAAIVNLKRLYDIGAYSKYGFFEAIDYTKSRVQNDRGYEIVESFMAHHLGMSICSINNILNNFALEKRFMKNPNMRAYRLLLEEKAPKRGLRLKQYESSVYQNEEKKKIPAIRARIIERPMSRHETQLLSNGTYTVFIRDDGMGFSKYDDLYLTRFLRDPVRGESGIRFYVKCDGEIWGLTERDDKTDEYLCTLEPHKVTHTKSRNKLKSTVEVAVSPDINGEIRKISFVNHSSFDRDIELMAYFEVQFSSDSEFTSHPAFVKLTVDAKTDSNILLFNRRKGDIYIYASLVGSTLPRYATDRLSCVGRCKRAISALNEPLMVGIDVSAPIEPCCMARETAHIKPGAAEAFTFIVGLSFDEEKALNDARELIKIESAIFDMSYHSALSFQNSLNLTSGKIELFERIAGFLIESIEKKPGNLTPVSLGVETLYKYAISFLHPIITIKISSITQMRIIKTLLSLKSYLSAKGIIFDFVIIGDYKNEYANELKTRILELTLANGNQSTVHVLDGFALKSEEEQLILLLSTVVIDPNKSLDKQFMNEREREYPHIFTKKLPSLPLEKPRLLFDNGLGGFDPETNEYVIVLAPGASTPLPWSNVLSNENFGAIITESGGGFTYKNNSRLKKITAFDNDPISDIKSETLFIKDGDNVFSIAPTYISRDEQVIIRHGFGYSQFTSSAAMLCSVMTVFVDPVLPLKYYHVEIKNPRNSKRELSAMFLADWALGENKARVGIITEYENNVVFAKNSAVKGDEYGFITIINRDIDFSCNRDEMLESVFKASLDKICGTGFGAFSIIKTNFTIEAESSAEFTVVLGMESKEKALSILQGLKSFNFHDSLNTVKKLWEVRLNRITINTRDEALNLIVNRWLLYQVYSSRLFARAGFYQCGGAIGFRDQLQDCLALLYINPEYAREHIKIAASVQFLQGDVLHWWHPPYYGVRTHISDDRLFLAFVALKYKAVTGDCSIFDENIAYLKDVAIPDGAKDYYGVLEPGDVKESLYKHCVRAIESVAFSCGRHGLPLMQGGDWNDGMDSAGQNGGESVWLALFVIDILKDFVPLCVKRGESADAEKFESAAEKLRNCVEKEAFDGSWYKRAFMENGELGSHTNSECAIDSITQSYAVFSDLLHKEEAYLSAYKLLVNKGSATIALLAPPFSKHRSDVGYIKNYIDGIRENGGQYTHAACWLCKSAVKLSRFNEAFDIFSMLNPINHTMTDAQTSVYKGEPYSIAGDVYTNKRTPGRAGWTFYTGSASLYYSLAIENILGIIIEDANLRVAPIPNIGPFSLDYKFGTSVYKILVKSGDKKTLLDNVDLPNHLVSLVDDGTEHSIVCYREVK
ncbi:MAG: glucoamylase family protein [Clostridia bacterium]